MKTQPHSYYCAHDTIKYNSLRLRTMKFTVLVAAYNAHKYLNQCLDSLFGQTEKSVQVIVIDDCSTDDSVQIEQSYTKVRDNCVLVLHTPVNSGQAEARNLGLKYAVGELTMMVDADDWLAPDCLERMWDVYSQNEEVDCVVNKVIMTENGREWEYEHPSKTPIPQLMTGREACLYAIDWRLHGYYAVRTELHKQIPYDTSCRLYSDDNTSRYHYLFSRRVALSEGIYYYRQHTESCTHAAKFKRLMFLRANMQLRSQLENYNVDEELLQICEVHCWPNFVGIYREMMQMISNDEITEEQREEIRGTLSEAYEALRLDRLGKHKLPYSIFCVLETVRKKVKRLLRH